MPPVLAHPEEELLLGLEPESPRLPRWVEPKEVRAPRGLEWLAEALLEESPTRPRRLTTHVIAGVLLEFTVLAILVLLPLMYTDTIDLRAFTQTLLVAPPPPPPPPPPAAAAVAARPAKVPKRVFVAAGKLIAPTAIPSRVTMLKEEELPPEVSIGVVGGVPGGVPGGQIGGVLGGIITGAKNTPVMAPTPPPARRVPLRVGGRVKAPRQIYAPQAFYPPLARQARIQGDVQLDAVIDEQGNVVELSVVSGHPLLIDAALKAVSQWRYEPTLLNDNPVPLRLIVSVRFRLTE